MSLFDSLNAQLLSLANVIPLELYTFVGAFIEEVVAPIPSPFVMTSAGSLVAAQGRALTYLFVISLIGAIGKTLGSLIVYFIADKGEDIVIGKFGKLLGVTHKEIEGMGKYFSGGIKDDIILFALRSLPVIPSAPVSVICGVIKVKMRTYVSMTFVGSFVRNLLYLFLGYEGLEAANSLAHGLDSVESLVQIFMAGALGGVAVWFYWQRRRGSSNTMLDKLRTIFK